ncbi:MAG: dihydroorotase [Candidatus Dormibacteria bacterium]
MRCVLRGVRVIDPERGVDVAPQDVWLDDGRIVAIDRHIDADDVPVIDLTPTADAPRCVASPGFIDLHAHLREPGDEDAETVASGAAAAAAGGFTTVVAMANTLPAIDTPARVREAIARNRNAAIRVLQVAGLSQGLHGNELTDVDGCIEAGAVAIGDDGRNAAGVAVLERALISAARHARPVLLHPEDEAAVRQRNPGSIPVPRCADRAPETEVAAVHTALDVLQRAPAARLHLQHLSTAESVRLLREARERGVPVTAEVTPHHLALSENMARDPLRKVNPPLRSDQDREALVDAVRDGVIDIIATDHAPHRMTEKAADYEHAAPGVIGLETALSSCLSLAGFGDADLPMLVDRLTVAPHRVLGDPSMRQPSLRVGQPATLTLFDPGAEWTVSRDTLRSRSQNTPLLGMRLRGRVLLTMNQGRVAYFDTSRIAMPLQVAHA